MAAFLDNCRFNPTLGGTTDWTFSSAVAGYQSPTAANVVNGTKYKYFAIDNSNNWELGEGAYNTGTGVLARTTILYSTNSNAKVSFAAAPQVAIVALKEDMISVEEANIFTVAQQAQALSNIGGISGGFANKFRNGTMQVAQRGTSGSVSAGTTAYTLDGWQVSATGAAAPWLQGYAVLASGMSINGSYFQIGCATGLTAATVRQRIESYLAAELLANTSGGIQPITVQFTVYNATGASITPKIATGFASARDNFATVTADLAATSLQSIANNTVATVAYTFVPSATATNILNGYEIQLQFAGALNAASGQVIIGGADIRATPGLPTGLNSNPPQVEARPIAAETTLCQRYYYQWNAGNVNTGLCMFQALGSTSAWGEILQFPEPMRAIPTVTSSAPSTFDLRFTTGTVCNALDFSGTTMQTLKNDASVTGWTTATAIGGSPTNGACIFAFANTSSAFIAASAEL